MLHTIAGNGQVDNGISQSKTPSPLQNLPGILESNTRRLASQSCEVGDKHVTTNARRPGVDD